ncbi:MAG: ligand-binding sensor domain-containing protein [Phycisphaerae bacterium]
MCSGLLSLWPTCWQASNAALRLAAAGLVLGVGVAAGTAAAALLVGAGLTAAAAAAAQPNATTETRLHCPAKFITAIATGPRGGLWVGDEDTGIYYRKAGATDWDSFNTSNSPGLVSNHIYSLCVDAKGRLWAGTLRHGVCVFNGTQWRHYGIITGPLGSHIVAIADNPRDGSVWMCSEAGISIYACAAQSHLAPGLPGATVRGANGARNIHRHGHAAPLTAAQRAKLPLNVQMQLLGRAQQSGEANGRGAASYKPHTWHYITRMNGLPANPDCIAFNKMGTAFVGTLCGGLAIAPYPYTSWQVIKGPWHMPRSAYGRGLPSNLINCVAVGPGGTVYVGTDLGFAVSRNNGESFRYERGRDYAAKVLGLWHPPIGYRPPTKAFLKTLLPGDHITSIAPIGQGDIWLGTWHDGYAMLNTHTGNIFQSRLTPGLRSLDGYVNALAITKGELLIGRYGSGAAELQATAPNRPAIAIRNGPRGQPPGIGQTNTASLPSAALAPSESQLKRMASALTNEKHAFSSAAYLGSDWQTQGDWVGHYGRQYAVLFACDEPLNEYVCFSGMYYHLHQAIGPHHRRNDLLRAWLQWKNTDSRRVLWDPVIGHRCEAELDDHGETYPTSWRDLGIWIGLKIAAAGWQRLSFYFFNKDGHSGHNRSRDYRLAVYGGHPSLLQAVNDRPIATARVVNFWGGVYESFMLKGPGSYLVAVRRNSSTNTVLQAAFIDRISGPPIASDALGLSFLPRVTYAPPPMPNLGGSRAKSDSSLQAIFGLLTAIHRRVDRMSYAVGVSPARLLALRAAVDDKAPATMIARLRWQTHSWTSAARRAFRVACNTGWKNFLNENPQLRGEPPH